MSYLIDSHCHLHDREFFTEEQAEQMLKNAKENNVKQIVCIGTNVEDSLKAKEFAESHDDVFWTFGIHPEYAEKLNLSEPIFDQIKTATFPRGRKVPAEPVEKGLWVWGAHTLSQPSAEHLKENMVRKDSIEDHLVAIGEVGLDYHYEGYNRDAQIKLFEEMLDLAQRNNLPVCFHIREAFDDFFGVINNFPKIKGVVHSFTDSKKSLKKILETTDFYVGVNGLATYSTLPLPPLERIFLETDAPFLTPIPFRGKINEPAYIKNIADWLSEKIGVKSEEIAKITTENVKKLYRIPSPKSIDRTKGSAL